MKFPCRVACIATVLLCRLAALPVTIGDPSFEGNSILASEWTNDIGPEWTGTGGANSGNAFEEHITGFVADGTDHLGMNLGHDVWQDLAVTYQANTRYTLTVSVGNRNGSTQPGNQSQYLLADSEGTIYGTGILNASTLATQTFGDAPTVVFSTPDNPGAVGKTIRILLQARGSGRSHFDNIRLDATSTVPPGAATVVNQAVSALAANSATLNGQVTNIGDGAPSIALFWGTTDGGLTAAGWQNSLPLAGTYSGSYSGGSVD